jgi:hypothetical protein
LLAGSGFGGALDAKQREDFFLMVI